MFSPGDGGCPGLSNSFAAGFFWVDQLGRAASLGYSRLFRQDLVGWSGQTTMSNYALTGPPGWVHGGNLQTAGKRPSFSTCWCCFKRNLFSTLFPPKTPASASRLFYDKNMAAGHGQLCAASAAVVSESGIAAHLRGLLGQQLYVPRDNSIPVSKETLIHPASLLIYAGPAVALAYVNLENATATVNVRFVGAPMPSRRLEYVLTSAGALNASAVLLNGQALTTALQPLQPVSHSSASPLTLPAHSYGFILFPNINAEACL